MNEEECQEFEDFDNGAEEISGQMGVEIKAATIIDEFVNGCCMDVPKGIGIDIINELGDQGFHIMRFKI